MYSRKRMLFNGGFFFFFFFRNILNQLMAITLSGASFGIQYLMDFPCLSFDRRFSSYPVLFGIKSILLISCLRLSIGLC